MECCPVHACSILTLLALINPSAANRYSFVTGIADDLSAPPEGQVAEITFLMDLLARHYTPKCLRVLILTQDTRNFSRPTNRPHPDDLLLPQKTLKYADKYIDTGNSKPYAHIIINPEFIGEAIHALRYITLNTERVTLFSCVTYLLTRPPDHRLMPLLTDSTSNKQLTRYFLVHTRSAIVAESFLLDQRLRDQENVAIITEVEYRNETTWHVLIRQLLHPTGSPQVLVANEWSRDKGFNESKDIFPEQMGNFYGMKLRGVTLDFKPFIDYRKIEGSLVVVPKPSLDVYILDVIAHKLNFTYELVMSGDGVWGYLKPDGHWSGVVGDVELGRANFSLVLSMTLERLQSVDFTKSYFRDPLTFVTAKSRPNPPWRKLITPFSLSVWLLALVSVVVGVLLYHAICRAQASITSSRVVSSRAFVHVFGSFLSQSLFVIPWLSSGRLFLGSWFLYAFLITTYYKTSLTATLAVPFVPPTIDTLQQLLASNLRYGTILAKGSEYQLFSSSKVPLYQRMFKDMYYYTSSESMELVAEGNYAYIYFKSNLDILVATQYSKHNGETDLHVATEAFFPGGYAWAFPKGAPYTRTFDEAMWRCVQGGLIDKWLKDLYSLYLKETLETKTPEQKRRERKEAQVERSDGLVVLSLDHLQGPFLILFLGSGFGFLTLVLEFFASRLGPNPSGRAPSRRHPASSSPSPSTFSFSSYFTKGKVKSSQGIKKYLASTLTSTSHAEPSSGGDPSIPPRIDDK